MKVLALAAAIILSCAQKKSEASNGDEPPPRNHNRCSVERTDSKIVFKCPNRIVEVSLSELKGADGQDGKDGKPGGRGPSGRPGEKGKPGDQGPPGKDGRDYIDQEIKWCHHDPKSHIDYTVTLYQSAWIETFGGIRGQHGYSGPCHHEGVCSCDQCPNEDNKFTMFDGTHYQRFKH